jgi:hypothetical protein
MIERRCRHCHRAFYPLSCQQAQMVGCDPGCQRPRRAQYRRSKIASDPHSREACRESARQWRKQHPDYWKQYREDHPAAVERNRVQQQARDCKRHITRLANNIPASELKSCPAKIWLPGSELHQLANNISAPAQLWVLEAIPPARPAPPQLANNIPLAGVSVSAG